MSPAATFASATAHGSLVTDPAALGFPLSVAQGMVDYPRINPIAGAAPQQQITQGAVNMGYDFSDNFSVYAFGTLSHRVGKGYENVRMPNKVLANAGHQPALLGHQSEWL